MKERLASNNFEANLLLLSESERALSQEQINELPVLKQLQLGLKTIGFSDTSLEIILKTTSEMGKANFQADYFNKLINHRDFITEVKLVKELDSNLEINNSKELSIAQKVISIMIIHKFYPFSKSQDRINLQSFIHVVTGNKHRRIGDFMAKFNEENNYLFHPTKRQNLEDYKVVKKYLEKMESKEITQFVDSQLITL